MPGPDGQPVQRYHPDAVTILPDQMRKFNVPNQQYEHVNKNKVRGKNAIFSETKNEIRYDQIVERSDWSIKSLKSDIVHKRINRWLTPVLTHKKIDKFDD